MFEQVTFARGWRNLPASASLEIRTQPQTQAALLGLSIDAQQPVPLQVYSASIEFHARFRGLRWLMYNWRVSSFLLFTSGFYCVALISTGGAWAVTTLLSTSTARTAKEEEQRTIKRDPQDGIDLKSANRHTTRSIKTESLDEEGGESGEESGLSFSNLSDNATTFPTFARQMPVRYPMQPSLKHNHTSASGSGSTSNRVKREGGDDETASIEAPTAVETLAGMTAGELAGDEEEREELDGGRGRDRDRDSGMGTSMEESAREVAGLQRRRGGRGGGGGSDLR